jgi:hypothetical protein
MAELSIKTRKRFITSPQKNSRATVSTRPEKFVARA